MLRTELLLRPYEDLIVGETFETTGRTVTEADVVIFAAVTGDRHPVHVDEQWAAASPFGQRIAHGMLVVSYAFGLVPFPPEQVIALRRLREVVFKRALHLGDTMRVTGWIEEKQEIDSRTGLVGMRAHVRLNDRHTCCRMLIDVIWRRAHHDA
jgi:3-hydroxybutyryl-CoA dehydratase